MSDSVAALVAIIAGDTVVATLATTGVFGGELPPAAVGQMPVGAVVIQATGGVPLMAGSYAEHDTQRIDVTSYGKTPREAAVLARRVAAVLRQIRRTKVGTTLVHWVNSAGGFSTGRDRDGRWPQVFQSFQIFHALEEV